ncbi:hypothetical protein A2Y99_03610 [Candidatus Gottesmanbacteria bacterium RBG_13_37_7]|uniref:Uncharacterized protein n=1 Tax=Candidatus Gottesmanbacteria bacterium RBG_13_37_7 TaxID=1798369 RepID=A0A1F5YJP8_9BACT|nr:MAG: hypothetical protein A2Y99_03610 [Candidatus Gottesmanbacteria bacterium RBG_13_37_7]
MTTFEYDQLAVDGEAFFDRASTEFQFTNWEQGLETALGTLGLEARAAVYDELAATLEQRGLRDWSREVRGIASETRNDAIQLRQQALKSLYIYRLSGKGGETRSTQIAEMIADWRYPKPYRDRARRFYKAKYPNAIFPNGR